MSILELIIGNVYYVSLIIIVVIIGLVLLRFAQQGRIGTRDAAIGAGLLVILALGVPVAGVQIGQTQTSYQVKYTVDVAQPEFRDPQVVGVTVDNVERVGPQIFDVSPQKACLITCEAWKVDVTVTCNDETFGPNSHTGTGDGTVTGSISGLPAKTSCQIHVEGEETATGKNIGDDTTYFTTGE